MTIKHITPGTTPRASKATGIDKTPRPIWVFIIKTAVPFHPTYSPEYTLLVTNSRPRAMEERYETYSAIIRTILGDLSKDGIMGGPFLNFTNLRGHRSQKVSFSFLRHGVT
jgi:hypothetical protein